MNYISARCETCPLREKHGFNPVKPKMHTEGMTPRYIVIGEAPGPTEVQKGVPFVGDAGNMLRSTLAEIGVDIAECIFSNTTWCMPCKDGSTTKFRKPTADEAATCLPHTMAIIAHYRPEVIVLAGGAALEAFTSLKRITAERGSVYRLGDFSKRLPFPLRYADYCAWAEKNASDDLSGFWKRRFTSADAALAHLQMREAQQEGYRPFIDDPTVIVPVFHPSYVLREGGRGTKAHTLFSSDLLSATTAGSAATVKKNYRLIDNAADLESYVDETIDMHRLGACAFISVDIEGSEELGEKFIWMSPFHPRTRIFTVQVSREDHEGVLILVNHKSGGFNTPFEIRQCASLLSELLHAIPVVGHNYEFDYKFLRCKLGVKDYRVIGDTLLADHWLTMGQDVSRALPALGRRYLGIPNHKAEMAAWRVENPGQTFEDAPFDIAMRYGCGDTDVTRMVYAKQVEQLQALGQFESYYHLYFGYHGSWQAIVDMMYHGMLYDPERWAKLRDRFPKRIDELRAKLNANHHVVKWIEHRRDQHNRRAQEYNYELAQTGNKRRKPRKVYDAAEWYHETSTDKDTGEVTHPNWWNPNSDKAYDELVLGGLQLMENMHFFHDLEMRSNGKTPKRSEHNRKVFASAFARLTRMSEAELAKVAGRVDQLAAASMQQHNVLVYGAAADLFETTNKLAAVAKTHSTYVRNVPKLTADFPEKAPEKTRERMLPIYRGIADQPLAFSLHPELKLHGTVSGRLSSANPNGQNWPKRKADKESDVTEIYISRWRGRGGVLLGADYSQIEVRVMVMLAKAIDIAAQIDKGLDIHKVMTSRVYRCAYEEVKKEQRTPTKSITFGILYGQGAAALATKLQITKDEAVALIKVFYDQIPEVKALIDAYHAEAKQNGYVDTLFNRRRYIPTAQSEKKGEVAGAMRRSVNTPIQSAASDMTLTSIGRCWKTVKKLGIPCCLPWLTIHDAQYWDVRDHVFDLVELIYYQMALAPYELWGWVNCRPEAEFDLGDTWGTMVEASFVWEDRDAYTFDKEHLVLTGSERKLDLLCSEWRGVETVAEEAHPTEEDKFVRTVRVKRDRVYCTIKDRRLVDGNGTVVEI